MQAPAGAARQTIAALIAAAGIDPAERRILLAHASGLSRTELVSRAHESVADAVAARFEELVARRAQGEPIAYLTGHREFYGRDFATTPAALIPRPETECVVERALEPLRSRATSACARILDLGTGCGILAVTLALEFAHAEVTAVELDAATLELARQNARALGARVRFVQSDWYRAIGGERFDLIVSNPPYIAAGDHHLDEGDLRFEPRGALSDGIDGLDCLSTVIGEAPEHLEAGGILVVEHGFDQGAAVRERFLQAGFGEVRTTRDLAGHERVTEGRIARG